MVTEAKRITSMICEDCHVTCQRFGKHRNGLGRFRCPACKRTFTEPHARVLGNMSTPQASILLALQLLVEGNSIRSTMRLPAWTKTRS